MSESMSLAERLDKFRYLTDGEQMRTLIEAAARIAELEGAASELLAALDAQKDAPNNVCEASYVRIATTALRRSLTPSSREQGET